MNTTKSDDVRLPKLGYTLSNLAKRHNLCSAKHLHHPVGVRSCSIFDDCFNRAHHLCYTASGSVTRDSKMTLFLICPLEVTVYKGLICVSVSLRCIKYLQVVLLQWIMKTCFEFKDCNWLRIDLKEDTLDLQNQSSIQIQSGCWLIITAIWLICPPLEAACSSKDLKRCLYRDLKKKKQSEMMCWTKTKAEYQVYVCFGNQRAQCLLYQAEITCSLLDNCYWFSKKKTEKDTFQEVNAALWDYFSFHTVLQGWIETPAV